MEKRIVIVANINNDREQRSLALKEIDDKCVGNHLENLMNISIEDKIALAKLYYLGGKLEDINNNNLKIISKSEDNLVRFEPSLVIKNIKITNQNVLITLGDILFDDMTRTTWCDMYYYLDYDDNRVAADSVMDTFGWNRDKGKLSLYKPMLKNIMKDGLIEESFIINTDDLVVLPSKAQQILHQGFGTTQFEVNQDLDTDNSDEHVFTEEEILGGIKIKNSLISEYCEKFSPTCKCSNYDDKITEKLADVRNITVEFVDTNVNTELDGNNYNFLISPESVDDSKYLKYSFQGSGGSYRIILPNNSVRVDIKSIAEADKTKDESWVFDISKQATKLDKLQLNVDIDAITVGGNYIKINQIHGQIIFKLDLEKQVISELLFEVDIKNKSLVLRNIAFNEEYIGGINDEKIKEIKDAINAISKIFTVPHPILLRYKGFPSFYWGEQLLLSLACPNIDKELVAYLQKEHGAFYQLMIKPVGEQGEAIVFPSANNPIVNLLKKTPSYSEINTLYEKYLESFKNNYLFCNSVSSNILNTNGYDLVADKLTGAPMFIKNFIYEDIKGQYLKNIVDGQLVTCIMNIEVVNAGVYDNQLTDLYRLPSSIIHVLCMDNSFSSSEISKIKQITINLTDSKKKQSNLVIGFELAYSNLTDPEIMAEYPLMIMLENIVFRVGFDLISGEVFGYGNNTDEASY